MYTFVDTFIPKCPNCNGEVEFADGDGKVVDCLFCGYSGSSGFHRKGSIPGCMFCAVQGHSVGARYLVSQKDKTLKVCDAACWACAMKMHKADTHNIKVHPLAADFTSMDDLR